MAPYFGGVNTQVTLGFVLLLKTSGKGLILGYGVDLGTLQIAQVKRCLMMSNAQKKLKKGKSHFEVCDKK
jgi:hypothetical protein